MDEQKFSRVVRGIIPIGVAAQKQKLVGSSEWSHGENGGLGTMWELGKRMKAKVAIVMLTKQFDGEKEMSKKRKGNEGQERTGKEG